MRQTIVIPVLGGLLLAVFGYVLFALGPFGGPSRPAPETAAAPPPQAASASPPSAGAGGAQRPGQAGRKTAERKAPLPLSRVKKRPEAPVFSLKKPDGTEISLKDYRGKVVVLNFWATWCPPCRAEMPSFEQLWRDMRDRDVVVLAVHVGPGAEKVRNFVRSFGLTFPVVVDDRHIVSQHYGVRSMPTTVILAPDGRVEYVAFGGREWNSPVIEQALEALRRS